jgi:hypothetical protein
LGLFVAFVFVSLFYFLYLSMVAKPELSRRKGKYEALQKQVDEMTKNYQSNDEEKRQWEDAIHAMAELIFEYRQLQKNDNGLIDAESNEIKKDLSEKIRGQYRHLCYIERKLEAKHIQLMEQLVPLQKKYALAKANYEAFDRAEKRSRVTKDE